MLFLSYGVFFIDVGVISKIMGVASIFIMSALLIEDATYKVKIKCKKIEFGGFMNRTSINYKEIKSINKNKNILTINTENRFTIRHIDDIDEIKELINDKIES